MYSANQIAENIPHEVREKILIEWLPEARASLARWDMQLLFDAWYIYVEPNGIKNPLCGKCVTSVLENWQALKNDLIKAEQDYNLLASL